MRIQSIIAGAMIVSSTVLAQAADKEQSPSVEEFSIDEPWAGVYVGVSAGHVFAEDDDEAFEIAPGVIIPLHSEGDSHTVGVFAGISFQNGQFVYGFEYEYTNLNTQFIGDGIGPLPIFIEDAHQLKARFGYAFSDKVHAYAMGGMMLTDINIGLSDWTPIVGAGIDFRLDGNVIVGAQYMHSWYDGYDGRPISGTFDSYSARVSFLF